MKFFFHSCLVFLFFFHVVCVCQPVLVPEMIQARVGIALDGRALGGGQRSQSYWNHRNAAPVGSITFLEKKNEKWGEGTEMGCI